MKPVKPPEDGPITKALLEAVTMRRQLLDGGMDATEADRIVGQGLKALLGNKRAEPWRFYCFRCRDTGWINVEPSELEQARLRAMYGDTETHAGYVEKCDPCLYMQREREKRRKQMGQEFTGDDDFAAAGQVKPKRGFSKFGK